MNKEKLLERVEEILRQKADKGLLSFYIDLFRQKILNYCHREDFPEELDLVLIDMVVNYMKNQAKEEETMAQGGPIASIARGDTTITYGSKGADTEGTTTDFDVFMTSYIPQLNAFRKVKIL